MKANGLMLGDWVIMSGSINQLDAGDLKNIFANLENDGKDDARYLSPIPLTAEILEKNGFEKEVKWWSLKEKGKTIFIVAMRTDGKFFIFVSNKVSIIQSVHQLQHALRLCGINKEIQLN